MTSHTPSTEHDLSGLRDHFNPRARWKAAIAGARALHRFGSQGSSRTSTSTKSSGGWRADADSDDDDDDDEQQLDPESVPGGAVGQADLPDKNDFVKVTPPEEDTPKPKQSPLPDDHANGFATTAECLSPGKATAPADKSSAHDLKHEKEAHEPLEQKVPKELHEIHKESQQPHGHTQQNSHRRADSEEYLNMPGSFYVESSGHEANEQHHGLWSLLRKLRLKSD